MSGTREGFEALFDPAGVIVAGVSAHPGKFGFVAAHNILSHDYPHPVHMTNRDGAEVLGMATYTDVSEIPDGAADLVFVCTPAAANPQILRRCAAKGVKAAFVASAGYGEAGVSGREAQDELVRLCDELGILLAGPNGQGVVSTPSSLCAQIVAPYPPRGRIGIASQSGNFVSSFLNYAQWSGVGVSRAVSAGNCAATTVPDYLAYFAADAETEVALTYVEGIEDGRRFYADMRAVAAEIPLVLVKGGTTGGGARAAASHTGSLAADDTVFDGVCAQAGISRAPTIEAAFEAAASFATQPAPRGPNVFVLTSAGGWGVVTADRITRSRDLELMALPADLEAAIDAKLPPRWSRNNPADMAGGETRDTVPELLEIVTAHPGVDAVIFLGLGIQSNQGRMEREGRFWPDFGLERIVSYHERQDARFAEAAVEVADRFDKPVLVATELAVTQPDNPGVARLRELGRPAFSSSYRAVAALEHMWRRARWRRRRGLDRP